MDNLSDLQLQQLFRVQQSQQQQVLGLLQQNQASQTAARSFAPGFFQASAIPQSVSFTQALMQTVLMPALRNNPSLALHSPALLLYPALMSQSPFTGWAGFNYTMTQPQALEGMHSQLLNRLRSLQSLATANNGSASILDPLINVATQAPVLGNIVRRFASENRLASLAAGSTATWTAENSIIATLSEEQARALGYHYGELSPFTRGVRAGSGRQYEIATDIARQMTKIQQRYGFAVGSDEYRNLVNTASTLFLNSRQVNETVTKDPSKFVEEIYGKLPQKMLEFKQRHHLTTEAVDSLAQEFGTLFSTRLDAVLNLPETIMKKAGGALGVSSLTAVQMLGHSMRRRLQIGGTLSGGTRAAVLAGNMLEDISRGYVSEDAAYARGMQPADQAIAMAEEAATFQQIAASSGYGMLGALTRSRDPLNSATGRINPLAVAELMQTRKGLETRMNYGFARDMSFKFRVAQTMSGLKISGMGGWGDADVNQFITAVSALAPAGQQQSFRETVVTPTIRRAMDLVRNHKVNPENALRLLTSPDLVSGVTAAQSAVSNIGDVPAPDRLFARLLSDSSIDWSTVTDTDLSDRIAEFIYNNGTFSPTIESVGQTSIKLARSGITISSNDVRRLWPKVSGIVAQSQKDGVSFSEAIGPYATLLSLTAAVADESGGLGTASPAQVQRRVAELVSKGIAALPPDRSADAPIMKSLLGHTGETDVRTLVDHIAAISRQIESEPGQVARTLPQLFGELGIIGYTKEKAADAPQAFNPTKAAPTPVGPTGSKDDPINVMVVNPAAVDTTTVNGTTRKGRSGSRLWPGWASNG